MPKSYGVLDPAGGAGLLPWSSEVTDDARRTTFDVAYLAKYDVSMSDVPGDVSVWAVKPRVAFAWQEKDFPGSATRWLFEDRR